VTLPSSPMAWGLELGRRELFISPAMTRYHGNAPCNFEVHEFDSHLLGILLT
jgi:hypothetical protein